MGGIAKKVEDTYDDIPEITNKKYLSTKHFREMSVPSEIDRHCINTKNLGRGISGTLMIALNMFMV